MNNHEFISYVATPNEQYFSGIATVKLYGRLIAKYKVVDKKDGSGYFIAPPNYRVTDPLSGDAKYIDAIMIDSKMENDDLQAMMRQCINKARNQNAQRQNPQQQQQYQQPQAQQAQPSQQNFNPDLDSCPF